MKIVHSSHPIHYILLNLTAMKK